MSGHGLAGLRVLVVEDEFFLAIDLEEGLRAAGATVVGPVATLAEALDLVEAGPRLDGAVLDVNLGGEMAYPVADRLLAQGVPFVFATGYGAGDVSARLAEVPRLEKPVDVGRVARAIEGAIRKRSA